MTTSNKNFKVKNGLDVSGEITSLNSNGLEGGQINLAKPGTTNLSGDVAIDIYENKIRFFDKGGSARGAYIDLSSAAEMVGTNLLAASGNGGAQNYAQTLGTKQSNISAPGTSIVSVSITTNGYPILVSATGDVENGSAGGWTVLQLYRGSTAIGNTVHTEGSAGSENVPYALHVIDTPAAGTYTYHLKLNNAAGGTFNFGESTGPVITAVELSGPKGDAGADGAPGVDGAPGIDGTDGAPGAGVAIGGTAGQILSKVDGTDYNTQWVDNQTTLNGLTDVDTTGVADGDALVYDDATGTWIPGAGGGSGSAVIMSDTAPAITGDGLEWHDTTDGTDYVSVGSVWVAQSSGVNLSSAADVRLTNAEANITDLEQQVRPVILGGTGATTAAGARANLEITLANIGAAATSHTHVVANITDLASSYVGKTSLNYAQSNSTAITVNTTTPTTVASIVLTTNGRPVFLSGGGDMNPAAAGNWHWFQIYRDSVALGKVFLGQTSGASYNLPFWTTVIDTPSAGTYTYSLKVWQGSGSITYGENGNGNAPHLIGMELF